MKVTTLSLFYVLFCLQVQSLPLTSSSTQALKMKREHSPEDLARGFFLRPIQRPNVYRVPITHNSPFISYLSPSTSIEDMPVSSLFNPPSFLLRSDWRPSWIQHSTVYTFPFFRPSIWIDEEPFGSNDETYDHREEEKHQDNPENFAFSEGARKKDSSEGISCNGDETSEEAYLTAIRDGTEDKFHTESNNNEHEGEEGNTETGEESLGVIDRTEDEFHTESNHNEHEGEEGNTETGEESLGVIDGTEDEFHTESKHNEGEEGNIQNSEKSSGAIDGGEDEFHTESDHNEGEEGNIQNSEKSLGAIDGTEYEFLIESDPKEHEGEEGNIENGETSSGAIDGTEYEFQRESNHDEHEGKEGNVEAGEESPGAIAKQTSENAQDATGDYETVETAKEKKEEVTEEAEVIAEVESSDNINKPEEEKAQKELSDSKIESILENPMKAVQQKMNEESPTTTQTLNLDETEQQFKPNDVIQPESEEPIPEVNEHEMSSTPIGVISKEPSKSTTDEDERSVQTSIPLVSVTGTTYEVEGSSTTSFISTIDLVQSTTPQSLPTDTTEISNGSELTKLVPPVTYEEEETNRSMLESTTSTPIELNTTDETTENQKETVSVQSSTPVIPSTEGYVTTTKKTEDIEFISGITQATPAPEEALATEGTEVATTTQTLELSTAAAVEGQPNVVTDANAEQSAFERETMVPEVNTAAIEGLGNLNKEQGMEFQKADREPIIGWKEIKGTEETPSETPTLAVDEILPSKTEQANISQEGTYSNTTTEKTNEPNLSTTDTLKIISSTESATTTVESTGQFLEEAQSAESRPEEIAATQVIEQVIEAPKALREVTTQQEAKEDATVIDQVEEAADLQTLSELSAGSEGSDAAEVVTNSNLAATSKPSSIEKQDLQLTSKAATLGASTEEEDDEDGEEYEDGDISDSRVLKPGAESAEVPSNAE